MRALRRLPSWPLALLLATAPAAAVAADQPKEPAPAVAAMPALRNVAISPLTALAGTPPTYGVKLGRGQLAATVFTARGTGGASVWVVGLALGDDKKARDLVWASPGAPAGGALDILSRLALAGPLVIVADRDATVAAKDLPPPLAKRLQDGGGVKLDSLALHAGVNVVASAQLAGSGMLEDLARTVGILPSLRAPLTGRVPAATIRALAGEATGQVEVNDIDVALGLPAIKPPGLEAVLDSKALNVTFKGDKGQVLAGGGTTVHLQKPAGGTVDVVVTLGLDPTPAEGKAYVRLAGAAPVDQVVPKLPLATLKITSLDLEVSLLKQADKKTPQAGFHGKGTLGASPFDVRATLAQTADKRVDVTLSIGTALKLADLVGQPVPGLDAVMLERVTVTRDSIGGAVRLGSGPSAKELTALVYTPAGKSAPNLAIGHPSLALSDVVPPLKNTPLDDLKLTSGALIVVPTGNDAKGLTAASLPPALVTMLGGPQADVLQRAGGVDLPAGVSVMASLDVSGSKPLHALLDAVGVSTTTRLPLAGALDRELFTHTPWGGKSGATALAKSFMDSLDISVPLPALTLPGDAKALTLKPGVLAVRAKGGLWLGIETGADVALPDRTLTVAPLRLSLKRDAAPAKGATPAKGAPPATGATPATGVTTIVTLEGDVSGTSHAGGDTKQLVSFPGLTVTTVGFTGQVDTTTRRLTAALTASGKLKLPAGEKPIDLQVSLDSGDAKAGSIQVLTQLAVNDFAPKGTDIPGIGILKFKGLTLTTTSVAGTVSFRNENTTVVAWTPAAGGDRRFALVHDKLKVSTYVTAVAGTSIGDLELDQTALIYVPKGGGEKGLTADKIPARLAAALGGKDGGTFPLDLAEGVNVSTLAKLPTAGPLHDLVDGLGLAVTSVPLRGVLDPSYLSAKPPARDKAGKWPRFSLNLDLPAFRPPGTGDHVKFEKGHVGVTPNPDGKTYGLALAASVAVTLDPAHVLRFTGAFTRPKPGVLTFSADAKVPLKAPFGIEWLALDELDLACSIDRPQKAVTIAVTGQTKVDGKAVKVVVKLIEEHGKLKDVVFGLAGKVPLSLVPGLRDVPGIGTLTVADPEVSRTHVSGEIDFRKKGKIRAAVFKDDQDWNLLFENSAFRLDDLLPGLAADHLKALSFPKTALLVSKKGFSRKASDLPPAITAIMVDLGLKSDDTVSAMAGVNLVTTLDPHTLSGPLRKAMDRLGVQQPVILSGAIGGLFGGSPSLTLEAVLPKVPVPQTKFLKMDAKADLRLLLALSPTQLSVGIGTDAQLRIGRDTLVFDASFNLIIQPADVIVDITGKLKGDWHQPMGIRGLVLEGVFLSVGIDVTGAAKLSLGGKAQIGDNEVVVEAGTSLQLEAAGIPTGLGLIGQMAHLGLDDLIAAADSITHAATGARRSSAGAPKEAVGFKDLTVAFVTPGIVLDKSLLRGADITIPDEGIALGATLLIGGKEVATVGGYAAPTGIKIGGEVKPFDVGPLRLYKAVVDFQTAIGAKPHFLLKGHAKLNSADVELDVTVDEGGFAFHTKDKFGEGVEVELTARTTNGYSLKNNDFSVHAELKADIGRHILDGLRHALEALFKDLEADAKTQKAKLADANRTVAEREKTLAAARAQVQRERATLTHDVEGVRKKLRDLDGKLKHLPGDIDHALKDASSAVRNLRFARAAELRVEAAAWQVELAGAQVADKATDALLKAIESGVADLPLDADPRVLADLVAMEAARVNAALLDLEVHVLDLVVTDLKAAANKLTDASILDIHRVMLDGTFGTQLRFTVDAKIFGKYDVQAVGAFSPKDAASKAAGLFAAAKDLASHLLSHKRTEHEQAAKLSTAAGPAGATPGAPAGSAPAAPAAPTDAVDAGQDALVAIGGDVDGVIYEIRKGR